MAFGAGTLIAAASEELFGPAFESMTSRHRRPRTDRRRRVYVVAESLDRDASGCCVRGLGADAGRLLDGVPENTALGVSMTGNAVVLLVAITWATPRRPSAAQPILRPQGKMAAKQGLLLWVGVGVVLVVVTVVAFAAAETLGPANSLQPRRSLAEPPLPCSRTPSCPRPTSEGGWWVGLATAFGFLVAFMLG